jgi:hypothetical protein
MVRHGIALHTARVYVLRALGWQAVAALSIAVLSFSYTSIVWGLFPAAERGSFYSLAIFSVIAAGWAALLEMRAPTRRWRIGIALGFAIGGIASLWWGPGNPVSPASTRIVAALIAIQLGAAAAYYGGATLTSIAISAGIAAAMSLAPPPLLETGFIYVATLGPFVLTRLSREPWARQAWPLALAAVPVFGVALLIAESVVLGTVGPWLDPARTRHTATLLGDGTVLVAGGENDHGQLRDAFRYDPARNTWARAGVMSRPRTAHAATVLGDGRVLVLGGEEPSVPFGYLHHTSTAELYDPATGSWRPAAPAPQLSTFETPILASDGSVITVLHFHASTSTSVVRYDPRRDEWSTLSEVPVALLARPRLEEINANEFFYAVGGSRDRIASPGFEVRLSFLPDHNAALVMFPDGRGLIAGGATYPRDEVRRTPLALAALYDPRSRTWTRSEMRVARSGATGCVLADGRVLVVGGFGKAGRLRSAEIYDPRTNSWSWAGEMGPF